MRKYMKLMRVKHWVKNLLILTPIIFHGSLLELSRFIVAFWGWAAYSLWASSVYIINDIRDAEHDRMHPTKKSRPIASGDISKEKAFGLTGILIFLALFINQIIAGTIGSVICLTIYFLLNILYSVKLKNVPIVDITILASGFLIRVLYGGEITSIAVSPWLYLTVTFMAFYLVLGKRKKELLLQETNGKNTREVLQYYTFSFLDKHMYLCLGLTIVFFALWAIQEESLLRILAVPFSLLICMRYNLKVEKNSDGDPVEVLLSDPILIGMCAIFGIAMLIMLYILG